MESLQVSAKAQQRSPSAHQIFISSTRAKVKGGCPGGPGGAATAPSGARKLLSSRQAGKCQLQGGAAPRTSQPGCCGAGHVWRWALLAPARGPTGVVQGWGFPFSSCPVGGLISLPPTPPPRKGEASG